MEKGRAARRDVCRSWLSCRRCLIAVLVSIVALLTLGHHATCFFNVHLCSPLWLTASNLASGLHASYGSPEGIDLKRLQPVPELDCSAFATRRSDDVRWVVILSTAISGSTFLIRGLASRSVLEHDEVLLGWSRECNGRIGKSGCTFDAMTTKITSAFRRRKHAGQTHALVKIQYDHVPPAWLNEFAAYCHCNDISVVHLIRTSLLETYWTIQARVMDVAQQGELRDRVYDEGSVKQLRSNQRTLHLPEAAAAAFVKAMESRRQAYRLLLHLYPHRILYTEIFYEDLTGPHGNHYFRALQHLLGMKPTALNTAGLVRVHPGHCSAKITNWPALRRYFLKHGLHQAVRACELPAGKI